MKLSLADTECQDRSVADGANIRPLFHYRGGGQGTGMGLAMGQGTATSHGVEIVEDRQLKRGKIISIFIPAAEGKMATEARTEDALPIGEESILFIDDEHLLLKLGSSTTSS